MDGILLLLDYNLFLYITGWRAPRVHYKTSAPVKHESECVVRCANRIKEELVTNDPWNHDSQLKLK